MTDKTMDFYSDSGKLCVVYEFFGKYKAIEKRLYDKNFMDYRQGKTVRASSLLDAALEARLIM